MFEEQLLLGSSKGYAAVFEGCRQQGRLKLYHVLTDLSYPTENNYFFCYVEEKV